MRALHRLLVLLALLSLPAPALAWWDYGHQIIARIAWMEASPRTRAAMRQLLRQSRALETPTCPAATIEQVAEWPDCIKRLRDRFSYAASWHYQNFQICRPFNPASDCVGGNCITAQIARHKRLLADDGIPVRERLMALAFLVHLVGDLHQPLHASDRGDEGGNDLPVSYGIIAGRTNLHIAWDGYLPDRSLSTPPGGAAGLMTEIGSTDRAAIRQGNIADWARESWEVGRSVAYGSLLDDPCGPAPTVRPVIREELTRRLIPIVRRQAVRAGLRLARLLDEALA